MTQIPSSKLVPPSRNAPRIALIGCGAIAEGYYLPALTRDPDILESLVLIDRVQNRARDMAAKFNVNRYFTDYHEIVRDIDGVIIALPTHLHHPVAMEFLSRGIHVLCEKPLSESAEKAEEMVERSRRSGAVLATNYSQRLWPQFAKAKEILRTGSLGKPLSIKYHVGELFKWPTVSGFYFNSPQSGRGILRDRGAHILDHICWWLGGKPAVIRSQNDSFGGSEAVAYVQFEFQQCRGEVRLSWLGSFPCRFTIDLEDGSIEGDVSYPQSILVKTGSGPRKRINLKFDSYMALGQKIVSNFIQSIAGRETPLVPGSEVLDSIRFTDECYASASRFSMPWYETQEVLP